MQAAFRWSLTSEFHVPGSTFQIIFGSRSAVLFPGGNALPLHCNPDENLLHCWGPSRMKHDPGCCEEKCAAWE